MFRDFDYIAAIAYEAQRYHDTFTTGAEDTPYADLGETERMHQVEKVMAIARNSIGNITWSPIFETVVRTIWDHNGGNGGLALERIVHLGQVMVDLELVDPATAGGKDMVECAVELLNELAGRRSAPVATSIERDPAYIDRELRESALAFAGQLYEAQKQRMQPEPVTDIARMFLQFLERPASTPWITVTALRHAVNGAGDGRGPASKIVATAIDYLQFLDPPKPIAPTAEVAAELEDATIQ